MRAPVVPPRRPIRFALALLGSVAAGGCARGGRQGSGDLAAFCRVEATAPGAASIASDPFFAGLDPLARAAERLAIEDADRAEGGPVTSESRPWFAGVEREFRAILPRVGLADTGALYLYAVTIWVPAAPARCAHLLLDVEAEKAALSAEEAVERRSLVVPGGERRVARFGMLQMGQAPFVYDFRWTMAAASRERSDGIVLVRYDLVPADAPLNVSAFSGVAILAPRRGGTWLTEVLAVGSPMSPPFFLKGKARRTVDEILTRRITRLGERMAAR